MKTKQLVKPVKPHMVRRDRISTLQNNDHLLIN